jgi:hypothetical protein
MSHPSYIAMLPDTTIGSLTVIRRTTNRNYGAEFICECVCGREVVRSGRYLRRCEREDVNCTCKTCNPRRRDSARKMVAPVRFYEPPRRRQHLCKVCGSLPWRVEGRACAACSLPHGLPPKVTPQLFGLGNLARAMAEPRVRHDQGGR